MPSHLTPPRLLSALKGYTPHRFGQDLLAGVLVGIVALPLSIAFAIASGVGPERGLVTAIVAGFLISALGGSDVQIGGPTGAFIVIVYGIVQRYGVDGLIVATGIAGIMLLVLGITGWGSIIRYVPYPVIVGFTAGIAVTIASSQVNDLLGLGLVGLPGEFLAKWEVVIGSLGRTNGWAVALGLGTVAVISLWGRVTKRIPGSLVAIVLATVVTRAFDLPVETIADRFGALPTGLPRPQMPHVTWELVAQLLSPALSIALLAAIESLLSAMVADGMIDGRHDSNTELIGQGVANIASALFGGIPATGAIARTATNVRNGGRTPVAGIVHALTLLAIVGLVGSYAAMIPLAALAGILLVVSWNMSEARAFIAQMRAPRSDQLVLLATFALTVLFDLTIAIQVGVVLAAFLFMRRMVEVSSIEVITEATAADHADPDPLSIATRTVPPGVEVFEINGAFAFGATEKFKEAMIQVERPPQVRILRMRRVPAIDSTGIRLLQDVIRFSERHGSHVILSGVSGQVERALERAGVLNALGDHMIASDIDGALARAAEIVGAGAGHQPSA